MTKQPNTGTKPDSQRRPAPRPGDRGTPGRGISSPHAGSKASYTHLTIASQLGVYERAAEWSRATGRPLPPHMRIRTRPVRQADPMPYDARVVHYFRQRLAAADNRPRARAEVLTGPQSRRLAHKANHARAPFDPGS